MAGVLIWGWDGANDDWVQVLVDSLGHLQVDILTNVEHAVDLYGYDGSNWQTLLVESSTLKNLRVKLYDGANAISSDLLNVGDPTMSTKRGLWGLNLLYGKYSATVAVPLATYTDPGVGGTGPYVLAVGLIGWDGTGVRRVLTTTLGAVRVGRAEVGLLTMRRTTIGQVKVGAGKLYWMTMNPTAANSVIELSNDIDGSTAAVWDMTHGVNSSHHMNLDPPMEFSAGIYLKTITNMTSIIFGYL